MHEFKKDSRLLSPFDFKKVFRVGNVKKLQPLLVFYDKNNLHKARLGLGISKKNVPLAVERNRIKRIIRESFRNAELEPFDYVIVARKDIKFFSNIELREKMDCIWKKLETS